MKGDVKLMIVVKPHEHFERRKMDLVHKHTISLKEALTGFSFELTHLNGKKLAFTNMNSRAIIHPGFMKVIPGLGMTRAQSESHAETGNLVIEFDVRFPDSLS